jgi:hypothetical protein
MIGQTLGHYRIASMVKNQQTGLGFRGDLSKLFRGSVVESGKDSSTLLGKESLFKSK